MKSTKVIAMILGGGAGSRLSPLTATRSKPAVPLAGKYRLVDIPISNCIHANLNRIFVLTQYNSASLNKHIKNTYQFSRFSSGFVDILAAEQTPDSLGWFQGTADAVRQSLKHIQNFDFEYVMILSGDQLYQMDLNQMLDNHVNKGADITIATIPVTQREATEFGILKSSDDGRITSFIEKPNESLLPDWISETGPEMKTQGRNYLASMGIYIFNRQLLFDLLGADLKAVDFGKEIIPNSIKNYNVTSYQYDGYWTDIGNIHSYFEANLALTSDIPPFNLFDNEKQVYSRARMLPPAKLNGVTLNETIIAEGSIIKAASIKRAVIGIRSRIGVGSIIESAYIMGNDFYESIEVIAHNLSHGLPPVGIGNNCFLKNVIVDKGCRIGNNVHIEGKPEMPDQDHEQYAVKDGIIVIKKNAVLEDGFRVS
jgi:glucose-1-phosphate adenylyltransferase